MRIRALQNGFFLLLLAAATLAFVWVVRGFFAPVFWAAALAIVFRKPYRRVSAALGRREGLAAALTTLGIVVLVLAPLGLLGAALVNEAMGLYARVASGELDVQGQAEALLPMAADLAERFNVDLAEVEAGLSSAAMAAGQYVAGQAVAIGQNALRFLLLAFVMLYTLFFFLRDGDRLIALIVQALPLGENRERRLLARFATVTRATMKGTLVVGAVQGAVGGVLFLVLGLDAPLFWGVIMAVCSLLPAVGPALVWGPAAVYLLATGSVVKGVVLIAGGALLIGTIDNVLRPLLVGRDTAMPDFLVLLSTLGGLALFGLTGIVVGPVVAALFLVVWQMFIEEYGGQDNLDEASEVEAVVEHPETVPPLTPKGGPPEPAPAAPAPAPPADAAPPPPPETGG